MSASATIANRETPPTRLQLDREARLIARLGEHGRHIQDGITDFWVRCERVREVIVVNGLGPVIAFRGDDGKPLTYREAFELVYGEPLDVQTFEKRPRPGRPSLGVVPAPGGGANLTTRITDE